MRRFMIMTTIVVLAQVVWAVSLQLPETTTSSTATRRIQVKPQTITALPRAKNYIVDLTQHGVSYEFDAASSQIDFGRVIVRSTQGELGIGAFLKKVFPKDKLTGFKLGLQSFSLSTLPTRALPTARSTVLNFHCEGGSCFCKGTADCTDLIFNTALCGDTIFCFTNSLGEKVCGCSRRL